MLVTKRGANAPYTLSTILPDKGIAFSAKPPQPPVWQPVFPPYFHPHNTCATPQLPASFVEKLHTNIIDTMKTVTPPLQKRAVLLHSSDTAIYLSTYPSIHLSSGIAVARRGQYGNSNTETQRRLYSSEATRSFAQGFTDRPFGASFHPNIAASIVIANWSVTPRSTSDPERRHGTCTCGGFGSRGSDGQAIGEWV